MTKMRSLLRKSTIIFISFLLVCLCAFVEGCASENDGFIYVSSITFVSDGKTITKNSRCHHEYSTIDEITEEEYLNSPSEDRWPYGYETYQIQNKQLSPPRSEWVPRPTGLPLMMVVAYIIMHNSSHKVLRNFIQFITEVQYMNIFKSKF